MTPSGDDSFVPLPGLGRRKLRPSRANRFPLYRFGFNLMKNRALPSGAAAEGS